MAATGVFDYETATEMGFLFCFYSSIFGSLAPFRGGILPWFDCSTFRGGSRVVLSTGAAGVLWAVACFGGSTCAAFSGGIRVDLGASFLSWEDLVSIALDLAESSDGGGTRPELFSLGSSYALAFVDPAVGAEAVPCAAVYYGASSSGGGNG